ncbi:hypothetical protein COY52_10405 [Candidatus Desantisbacteria bacterium CG_4_10_14_0_8_um_filter_48_22]|uniref:Methyltransferase domain-containing protein n=1 Tax=Candidatus Desantisbacteria bacterium CG_4_10_14_0_8_um_filter_48_22 TaxID=1974543 RepID=A0A2M7S6F4_9BACT|nr:MAG: hypothetical protein COS16_01730 [Candidatus Desantisbacteria bacterium CG02_land_8_20_14_3_00_49_13]PIZ15135.1 MAG: hypothetical protein COY52_10405 [Candidatus Desantisbacteria bacterium CG_4_10_14_0_8_um_filter_48_22]
MRLRKKYYKYYEDIYKAVFKAGIKSYARVVAGTKIYKLPFKKVFDKRLIPPPAKTVEFGCGEGEYSIMFARQGYSVLGIDASPSAIRQARKSARKAGLKNVKFRIGDITNLPFLKDESFNLALDYHCYHCLSKREDRPAYLKEAYRILKPGGIFHMEEMGYPEKPKKMLNYFKKYGMKCRIEREGAVTRYYSARLFKKKYEGKEVKIPMLAMAHRFFSKKKELEKRLSERGFKILRSFYGKEEKLGRRDINVYARKCR